MHKFSSVDLLICCSALSLCLFVSCRAAPTAVPADALPTGAQKLLATVYISPTPNEPEQTATRRASQPTETPVASPQPPTPTVYIGVFLGEAGNRDDIAGIAALQLATPQNQIAPPTLSPLASCLTPVDDRFGTHWMQAGEPFQTMGCPASYAVPFDGIVQVFERGAMYFTPDGAIWAIGVSPTGPGHWWFFGSAPPGEVRDVVPPPGLKVPSLGFGAVWASVPGVRDALGFARTDEQGVTFTVQDFQGGTLLLDNGAGQVFILLGTAAEGDAHGPY
jgi:hypothetical protein